MIDMEVALKQTRLDLPSDALQKLSAIAASQSKSLKSYMESALINLANTTVIEDDNPSPSGDTWWNDPRNVAAVKLGIAQMEAGKGRIISDDELDELLPL
jgi:hypothetical protein